MRQDVVCFTLAIFLVLSIYLVVAGQGINFWRKVLILVITVAAALSIYFGARDLLGRPTPFTGPGKYIVEHVFIDSVHGLAYVFVSGKEDDPNFGARLLILPKNLFAQSEEEIGRILNLGQQGYRTLIKIRGGNWYGGGNGAEIYVHDPLGELLRSKQNPAP